MGPRAGDGSLVDRYGSQILWLLGPGVLDCCFGLLVGWASAQGVLSHWGVRLVPRLGLAHRWVETVPRVSACRALGGPGLLLHTGVVGLGPGSAGGQDWDPGRRWAQWSPEAAGLLVGGLCLRLASCLAFQDWC